MNGYDILEPCFISEYDPEEPCFHCVAGAEELDKGGVKSQTSFSKLGQTERPLPVRIRIFGYASHLANPARNGFVSLSNLANKHSALCNVSDVTSFLWSCIFAINQASQRHFRCVKLCIAASLLLRPDRTD